MIQSILKTELLVLFILTIASFYYFYFFSTLPDNIYSVSSVHSEGISVISYYFYSLISIIGFFVGPWVFFPFLVFSLFYSFILSKRSFVFDSIVFFSTTIFFLGIFTFFAPDFVGDGLFLLIKRYVGVTNFFILSFLLLALTLFLTFRMNFIEAVKSFFLFIIQIPRLIASAYQKLKAVGNSISMVVSKSVETTKSVGQKVSDFRPLKKIEKDTDEPQEFVRLKSTEIIEASRRVDEEKPELANDQVISEEDKQNILSSEQVSFEIGTKNQPSDNDAKKTPRDFIDAKIPPKRVNVVKNVNYKDFVDGALTAGVKAKLTKDPDQKYFSEIINAIEDKLKEFKIDGKIVNILKGPVVDTFELELGAGVKVSKVTGLTDDLSLALAGAPIRMEYAAVGRTTIGIEVPRDPRDFIYLDEVLSSGEYRDNKKKLPLAMGQNVVGDSYVVDLASAPHMLVAGETGSGKSVFVHSLIVSLLMQKSPQSLRLLMIDPKQIEMMPYSKLPHLLMPVIINDKEASLSLMWACQEMDKRYSILREFGVRNIEGFNDKLKDATPSMLANIHQYYEDDNYELPYIVVVVDEYADLILGPSGKEIENSICRLGQKARAAGIHVILTTQRPSANVVTGLIKANFPTRVSLKVTSNIDSRVILDKVGAEKLLGNGDMLYKKGTELIRIHSSFVSVEEVETLVAKLSGLEVSYDTGAMEFLENGGNDNDFAGDMSSGGGNIDETLFNQAVDFVLTQKMASTSSLQRKFRIGYNKAADLADLLERRGVVGPSMGSKGREVIGPPQ